MSAFAYLKYIRIYGAPEDAEEEFQGLGAGAEGISFDGENLTVNVDGESVQVGGGETSDLAEISSALWEAQNNVIREQSAFLADLSDVYAMRMSKVPERKTLWEEITDQIKQESVEFFLGLWVSSMLGEVAGEAAEFLYEIIYTAYEYLKDSYNKASKLCDRIIEENTELLSLGQNAANYALRTDALKQHDSSMQNIIRIIESLEDSVKTGNGNTSPVINVTVDPVAADFGFMKAIADGPVSSVIS